MTRSTAPLPFFFCELSFIDCAMQVARPKKAERPAISPMRAWQQKIGDGRSTRRRGFLGESLSKRAGDHKQAGCWSTASMEQAAGCLQTAAQARVTCMRWEMWHPGIGLESQMFAGQCPQGKLPE